MGGFVRAITKTVKKVAKASPVLKIAKTLLKPEEQKQGIELAKQVDPQVADVQKEAANKVKGPTTTEMADNTLLTNKRKGRRITNITAKKTLDKDYKLSEKTLLG